MSHFFLYGVLIVETKKKSQLQGRAAVKSEDRNLAVSTGLHPRLLRIYQQIWGPRLAHLLVVGYCEKTLPMLSNATPP